jgi:hypothetical protein
VLNDPWNTARDYRPRTLPLRVAPASGEAVDSWLAALARRHNVAFCDLLESLGLCTAPSNISWWLWLPPQARHRIAQVTGVDTDNVRAMTLHRYLDAAQLEANYGPPKNALWIRSSGSRFCPDCLRDNPGCSRLSWRLNWHFACIEHRRLLTQNCPQCGHPQCQRLPHARVVPAPGNPCRGDRPAHSPCTHDLGGDWGAILPASDPILQAQNIIIDLLDGDARALAAYSGAPQHNFVVLRDLKMLARWSAGCVAQRHVETHLPADLAARFAAFRTATDWPHGSYWSGYRADPTVDETTLGTVIAVKLITAKGLPAASEFLRGLMQTATPVAGLRDAIPIAAGLSPEIRALCDSAYEPVRANRQILRLFRCTAARSSSGPVTETSLCR